MDARLCRAASSECNIALSAMGRCAPKRQSCCNTSTAGQFCSLWPNNILAHVILAAGALLANRHACLQSVGTIVKG
eukprot:1155224-Pelagomonas_calceolata.AAC.14